MRMGGADGYATTLNGKKEKVERVKELLQSSQMIVSVPPSSLTVKQTGLLRNSMPEGTTVSVVKNKLMARAVQGTEYESAVSILKGTNMWFFIQDDIGATLKAYNEFLKNTGKRDTHYVQGGVIDGQTVTPDQVTAISKLPSKLQLISMIAGAIKAVPTKVARVINAPNTKLARAIKLATDKQGET